MKTVRLTGVVLAALGLAIPVTGRAQGDITWGLKGGLNVSTLRGASDTFDSKRGVVAGGFGVFEFAPEFSVEVDALFDMKGAKVAASGIDVSGNFVQSPAGFFVLDYLEIPVLARLHAPSLGSLKPYVYAGPTLAFRLSARAEYTGLPSVDLDSVRMLDSGVAFGLGADLPVGTHELVFDVRYGLGLTNAVEWGGPSLKNDAFSLMAGFAF
jgi:hypothetical protein